MKKIFRLLTLGALSLCSFACGSDDTDASIQLADKFYLPRDGYAAEVAKGLPLKFEWAYSKSADKGYITYEILFDRLEGDFSSPLFVASSDNNGANASATLAASTLNTVATLAGADYGQTAEVKWTVRAWKGSSSEIYPSWRALSIVRMQATPFEVRISGSAVEGGEMMLGEALPVATQKGNYVGDTELGAFEAFLHLSEGELQIYDDLDYWWTLGENNAMTVADQTASTTIDEEGVYWLYLKFTTRTWSLKRIDKVEAWTNPWWGGQGGTQPLTYAGNGVWTLDEWAWDIADASRIDSRYHFIATYADGTQERWGYWDDDCRNSSNPEGDAKFYNVYRFSHGSMNDDWAHSWKTRENLREGASMLVSFRLSMNRTDDKNGNYVHTRDFKPRGDLVATGVEISGTAVEEGQTLKLHAALPLIADKGSYTSNDRMADTYACFTRLTADDLTIKDDLGHYYTLSDGRMNSFDTQTSHRVDEEGIYYLSLNLREKSYTLKRIDKVSFHSSTYNNQADAEMTYRGQGVWSLENYYWENARDGGFDTRYYFWISYADGSRERLGYWDDDCRNSNNPDGDQKFYDAFRFDDASWNDAWAHTWKTRENIREGENSLATFRLCLNDEQQTGYRHERQFRGVDEVLPSEIVLSGATENGAQVKMFGASKIGTAKSAFGEKSDALDIGSVADAFEVYTRLETGKLTVRDDSSREWTLADGGALTRGSEGRSVEEGIYWIRLDFDQKKWEMKRIEKVILWNNPWFMGGFEKELAYQGGGVWAVEGYEWTISNGGSIDSRYNFQAFFADGTKERWSHWEDDCRGSKTPDADPNFFNVYRFTSSIDGCDNWGHTWKVNEDAREGEHKRATFRLHMNRTDRGYFYHERQFE